MEKIKTIKGFEDYKVSSTGKIYNKKNEVMKTHISISKCGYATELIVLRKDKKPHTLRVSRLVATAFVDGYFEGALCGHKDDDSRNNNADNLYWTTFSENNSHNGRAKKVADLKRKNGDYKKHSEYMKNKYSKPILQYSLDGVLLNEFKSAREAERITGLDNGHIGKAAKGIYSQYRGFIWKYKNN